MRTLFVIFISLCLVFFIFGKATLNGENVTNPLQKLMMSIVASFVTTFVLGLPIVGLISLFK